MHRWGALFVPVAIAALMLAGCGEDETSYSDDRIVERLNLERTDTGYAIDGDPFCEVDKKLLNDAGEVGDAEDRDDLGLVISSREGNAGVLGVPPFAPDCGEQVKRQLNKLDPVPKEDES
ncbi:MAG: hypothetical protein K0R88_1844 [Solirubrobacterales bacterium]|nr:hypothetical protein [Solirubrobacterales bacterium]